MTAPGRVIVLNGTASAGKTSLARVMQREARDAWTVMAQDDFAQRLVPGRIKIDGGFDGGRGDEGFHFVRAADGSLHVEVGEAGRVARARDYRFAVGAGARAGNNVLVDECKFDPAGWDEWQEALAELSAVWVRVECDLDVCERREAARADRQQLLGLARGHYEHTHADARYDLTVDLTDGDLEGAARFLLAEVE